MRHAATKAEIDNRVLGRVDEVILNSEMEALRAKALEFSNGKINVILSSPLLRAKQTAEILAKELKVDVREHEELMERDFGILNGLTWEEFSSRYPQEIKSNLPHYQPDLKNAETIEEVEKRVTSFISDLPNIYQSKSVLLITHSGVIRIILREFGHLNKEETRKIKIGNLDVFEIELPD
jgi:broad specificity phosphatase PhoE